MWEQSTELYNNKDLILKSGNIQYRLYYQSRWHWSTPELDGYRIVLNKTVWRDGGNGVIISDLGETITIVEEAGNRRLVSKLKEIAKHLTPEVLEDYFKGK